MSNSTKIPVVPMFEGIENTFEIPGGSLELPICCNSWPADYPYSPKVKASMWHNGSNLFINFEVEENFVRANAKKDNDKVSKDSCVELFISFDDDGYYNLEANCTGKILLSHRRGRKIDVEYASPEILEGIKRNPSLGVEPFDTKTYNGKWNLLLSIPVTTFFKHNLKSFSGLKANCNLYKCGDELPVPHFLSWKPISSPAPDFHRPEFFSPVYLS